MSQFSELPNQYLEEIASTQLTTENEAELFRIRFLGTKNVLKDLFGAIKDIPNETKKEYGLLINSVKQAAEEKYNLFKENNTISHTQDIPDISCGN